MIILFINFLTFYTRNISQGGKTPDDALFRYLSIKYASKNPKMANGSACQEEHFKNGITNGAEWYELEGWYLILRLFFNLFLYFVYLF